MTEFEQQVAAALRFEILKVRELNSSEAPMAISVALAPRVAAVIDRLARMYVDDVHGGDEDSEQYRAVLGARREDGLATLRRTRP